MLESNTGEQAAKLRSIADDSVRSKRWVNSELESLSEGLTTVRSKLIDPSQAGGGGFGGKAQMLTMQNQLERRF